MTEPQKGQRRVRIEDERVFGNDRINIHHEGKSMLGASNLKGKGKPFSSQNVQSGLCGQENVQPGHANPSGRDTSG